MRKHYILISLLLIITGNILYCQKTKKDEKLVQFSGRLTDELLQPLPYVHIVVLNDRRNTLSDDEGKFSFVTEKDDTILFSSVGYKRKIIKIPNNLSEPFYTIELVLKQDTIRIKEVRVYSWRNYEEFQYALVNLELPKEETEKALKNISIIKAQLIIDYNPSAMTNYKYIMREQTRPTMAPSYSLLNPFAWSKFFESLKGGTYKRKEKR